MLNIAHRGYTRDWPGNTVEAIEAAVNLGVDAVEVDVQETRDGGFVLAHDPIIGGRVIRQITRGEVMGLDVGEGCRAPTLEEALDLCRGRIGVVLEFKEVRSLGRVIEVINGSAGEGEVGICSFDAELLMKVRNVKAGIRLGLIVDAPPENPEVVLATLGCEVIGVRVHHVTRGLVERVRASGRKVFGWGLEDAADVEAVLGLGVDGVVSDFPDVVKGILEGGREGRGRLS